MKSTFSVIYYLKRQVVKKDGTVPVMGRITVDGSQTQFSCKLTVDPKLWDTKGGRVTGRSTAALETNRMLDKMRVRINRHYQEIMERDNFVTAEKVKNAFLGLEHRYHTLMQVFRQHNEDYEKQVEAGMKAKGTLLKYRTVYKHMQEFLDIRYHVKDIALKELTPAFISDFEMFLRTDKHCCTNTVWLYVCPLRTMVFIAINNEWLTRDPFREYEIKKEETTRSFLTKDEIRLLMEGKLKNAKQELYRDLYLFCAFTGLSFADMRNLTEENIRTYFDEHEWININRQKTGVVSNIRLLEEDPSRLGEEILFILPRQIEPLLLLLFAQRCSRPRSAALLLWVPAGWLLGGLLLLLAALVLGHYGSLQPYPMMQLARSAGLSGMVPVYCFLLITAAFFRLTGLAVAAARLGGMAGCPPKYSLWAGVALSLGGVVLLHYTGWPDAAVYPILAVTGLLWLIFALLPPRGTGNKRDRRR